MDNTGVKIEIAEMLYILGKEFPNIKFEISDCDIVAKIKNNKFNVLNCDGTSINFDKVRNINRMIIFYEVENKLILDGHRGKFAAINDDGKIDIFYSSSDAYKLYDTKNTFVQLIGAIEYK